MNKEFKAKKEELESVISFIHENLSEFNNMKTLNKIDLVVEEIFINIVNYAYQNQADGNVLISIEKVNNKAIITFEDSGIEFNPLSKDDPDITLSSDERQIGGLGIYLVKKLMDNIKYEYKDNKNILIVEKNIEEV